MNKVFHINLGGYPFTIDEDAYTHLSQYLETIHQHFKSSEGYEDITSDIESRLAELFQESLAGRSIVIVKDVKDAITIMGTPEEFGAAPIDEDEPQAQAHKSDKKSFFEGFKPGKRLFRDIENKKVGGVCAGIATYLGIQDPLWVRIFFIVLVPLWGFTIPLYIILMFILPEAKTAADRLAMRGEPINVSSIAKTIEEGVESLSRKINDIGTDFQENGKKKGMAAGVNVQSSLNNAISFVGEIFGAAIRFAAMILKPLFFVAGALSILTLLGVWFGIITGGAFMFPMRHFFIPGAPITAFFAYVNAFFISGIPLIAMVLLMLRIFFRRSVNGYVHAGMWGFWLMNVICFVFIGTWFARQFSQSAKTTERIELSNFRTDTLQVVLEDSPYNDIHFNMFNTKVTDEYLVNENVRLSVEKSDTKEWQLIQENHSKGSGYREASSLASQIDYTVTEKEGVLHLTRNFLVNAGTKFRDQSVHLILKVPEGKFIKIRENVNEVMGSVQKADDENGSWGLTPDYAWKMEAAGLVCIGCPAQEQTSDGQPLNDQTFSFHGFNEISVSGAVSVYIEQGAEFKVRMASPEDVSQRVEVAQSGNKLSVNVSNSDLDESTILYVTLPALQTLRLENTGPAKITGFNSPELTVSHVGENEVKLQSEADKLILNLEGPGVFKLIGKGRYMKANLDEEADLDGQQYECREADIFAFGDSHAQVSVSETLRQKVENEDNTIKVFGNPVIVKNQ